MYIMQEMTDVSISDNVSLYQLKMQVVKKLTV